MGSCYVVFYGKKPGIYSSWHEASEHVLGVRNAIHKKYNNYDHALRDFNAYIGASTSSPELGPAACGGTIPLRVVRASPFRVVRPYRQCSYMFLYILVVFTFGY
jgi:hypothetical protein